MSIALMNMSLKRDKALVIYYGDFMKNCNMQDHIDSADYAKNALRECFQILIDTKELVDDEGKTLSNRERQEVIDRFMDSIGI